MKQKLRVGIIFGGRSTEHEVSLQSAKNVIEALDKSKFEPVLIGIDKTGRWQLNESSNYLLNAENPKLIKINNSDTNVTLVNNNQGGELVHWDKGEGLGKIDVVFPVLHGPYGEDGTMQGLLKLFNVPFVGCSVLGSAIGMDKDVMKRLLREAGIPIAKFIVLRVGEKIEFNKVKKELGVPMFIKPANAGSSVGVSKVENKQEFDEAIKEALKYDSKILIEQGVKGREIEVAVLGNEDPQASIPGEVIPTKDFYSYDAKYISDDGAILEIPAKLSKSEIRKIQQTALEAYKTLCAEGMSRVDMFLTESGEVFINEINTIPGFTKISMYPKLWEISGLSYKDLITKLIELAIERHKKEQKLKTSF